MLDPVQTKQLQERTTQFAIRIVKLFRALPRNSDTRVMGNQLLRSGTSVAANYRAACRSRSRPEFAARIAVALEEVDESRFWLDLLVRTEVFPRKRLDALLSEADELIRIFSASRRTTLAAIKNQKSSIINRENCR
jgi:four helix bundle protein